MPRKKRAIKRPPVQPDMKFNNVVVEKFINHLMLAGQKSAARKIVYDAFERVEKSAAKPALQTFAQALKNISPVVAVKTRRVGGANYQVPIPVAPERRRFLAMKWLIEAARLRSEHTMGERLANEMLAALKNEGGAMKKREQVHRMAEANKAFAYMSW